jgi:hypothetical protein
MYYLKISNKYSFSGYFSFALLAIVVVVFVLTSCEKVDAPIYDNPNDPLFEDFILPQATIKNFINQGAVLDNTTITFIWEGIHSNSDYSFMLKGFDDTYSEWQSGIEAITYSHFDEGNYTFFIRERYYADIVQEIPDSLVFSIDAIIDCAILLRNWAIAAAENETFSLYLDIENVSKFKGLKTLIEFPPSNCTFQSAELVDSQIDGADGMLFLFTPEGEANNSGEIEINAISLSSGTGFSGNAPICKLNFLSKSSSEYAINIDISNSGLRDIDNTPVTIDFVRGAVVNVPRYK